MPKVQVQEMTLLAPETVLAAAHDFTVNRAELWPDVHLEHFTVHDLGETHADVTEGNPWPLIGIVWERLRYDWSQPGVVKGTVIDSNLFKPGSTWEINAKTVDAQTQVGIVAVRHLKGRGLLTWPFFPTGLARQTVAEHLRHFLSKVEELEQNAKNS